MLSLGVLIGGPIAITLLAVSGWFFFWARTARRFATDPNDHSYTATDRRETRLIIRIISAAVFVATFIVAAGFFYPYDMDYHRWDERSGTVAEIDNRLLGGDNGPSESFVVQFEGSPQEYRCDDTRCALVEPGDRLTISCKKIWQFSGTDGWGCNFVSNREPQP